MAKAIAVQAAGVTGTGSGKSLTVALLCRLFSEDGYRASPFKALNLTNVTYKDDEGREFGYSQALQAVSAGIKPDYRMNPFTPKPLGKGKFELLLEGRTIGRYEISISEILRRIARGLSSDLYEKVMESVERCLKQLMDEYDIICIEGSGPSKIRGIGAFSKFLDIPNMKTAELASAPVVLLANSIDSAIATFHYLSDEERSRIKGIVLNRFQLRNLEKEFTEEIGVPRRIFEYGMRRVERGWLKMMREVKVLGSIPYLEELSEIPDLDPIFSDKKVNMDLWRKLIPKIAKKVRKRINMDEIYRTMGL